MKFAEQARKHRAEFKKLALSGGIAGITLREQYGDYIIAHNGVDKRNIRNYSDIRKWIANDSDRVSMRTESRYNSLAEAIWCEIPLLTGERHKFV